MIGNYMEMQVNEPIMTETTKISSNFVEKPQNPAVNLSSEELLNALYFIWDAAERGQLQMFLTGNTAKQVIAQEDLSGDKITVGVRRNEWDSGQGRIAQTFLEHELGHKMVDVDNEVIIKARNGVPIHIKLYDENPTLDSFDIVFYRYETFNLPNPYKTFLEKYE